jgi:hypothetical protein
MRFYVSYTNRRGKTYGTGTKDGYSAHVRGWHAGVKVTPRAKADEMKDGPTS